MEHVGPDVGGNRGGDGADHIPSDVVGGEKNVGWAFVVGGGGRGEEIGRMGGQQFFVVRGRALWRGSSSSLEQGVLEESNVCLQLSAMPVQSGDLIAETQRTGDQNGEGGLLGR